MWGNDMYFAIGVTISCLNGIGFLIQTAAALFFLKSNIHRLRKTIYILYRGMWLEKAVPLFRAIIVVCTIGLVGISLGLTLPYLGERSDIANQTQKIAIMLFLGSVLILVTIAAYLFYYLWRLILQFCQETKKKAMSFDKRKSRVLKGAIMTVFVLAVVYVLVFCIMFYLFGEIAVNEAIPLEIFSALTLTH